MARYEDVFILRDKVSKTLENISGKFEKINGKLTATEKKMEHFRSKTESIAKLGNKIKGFGQAMTVGITLPVIAAGGAMVKMASDMDETLNKVDVSFGASSDKVKEWAKNSIKSMGLAQQSALDSAALYGDMATGMGLSQEKASDMAMSLTQLSADLASFKNISNEMAQTALKSIFTGETESLKNLGVVMTEANLKQFAMSKGIRKNIKNMTEQEKIQLRYNYVMEKTKNAHGDFIRTGGGASNQMRMFQENLKELGVTFGQYILPYFTKAVIKLNSMLVAFNNLSPGVKKTILIVAGILAVVGPVITVIGSLISAIHGVNLAFALLAGNPVVLTIMAIVAAIAIAVVVIKNWGKIWEWLKSVFNNVVNFIMQGIKKMTEWLDKLLERLGFLAYLIPGLNAIKIGKNIAGLITSNKGNSSNTTTNNNVTNSNNTTTTNNYTTNNYSAASMFNSQVKYAI